MLGLQDVELSDADAEAVAGLASMLTTGGGCPAIEELNLSGNYFGGCAAAFDAEAAGAGICSGSSGSTAAMLPASLAGKRMLHRPRPRRGKLR